MGSTMSTTYKIYVGDPTRDELAEPIAGIAPDLFKQRGYLQSLVDLDTGRKVLDILRRYRGSGCLVPSDYLHPRVSVEEARERALVRWRELENAGRRLGELQGGWDDFLWWSFRAQALDAMEGEFESDQVTISVDKLDGRIRTAADLEAWGLLSGNA